jgi:hypothetical protein
MIYFENDIYKIKPTFKVRDEKKLKKLKSIVIKYS